MKNNTAVRKRFFILFFGALFFCLFPYFIFASTVFPSRTVYFGLNMGGGSTEWKYLVDTNHVDPATPKHVSEGGPSWGVVLGYVVKKNLELEWQYMQFANADIDLSNSVFSYPELHGATHITSRTDAASFSLKFLTRFGHTHLRAFAAVGPGWVRRADALAKTKSAIAPYMSAGLAYNFTRHWIVESGFQYYTGFGRSSMHPVRYFIPFAWDAYARLAYQI